MSGDCEFLKRYWSKASADNPPIATELCELTGRMCLCPDDFHVCIRRTWGLEYQAKQAARGHQVTGIG